MKIGFIGLGIMGHPILSHLLKSGYDVLVTDTSEEAKSAAKKIGAIPVQTPKIIANEAEIVLLCLPMPSIVNSVVTGRDGVIEGNKARVVIDLSTTGAEMTQQIAKQLVVVGKQIVDAPVSGGLAGALAGRLSIMVSCPEETLSVVQPILSCFGKTFWVGKKPGMAQTLKLINNYLNVTALVASSEAFVMGVKAGLDPVVMAEVINVSSGRNTATMDKFPRHIIPRTFDFGFTTGLAYKDVKLCLDEAEKLAVPMLVGGAVRQFCAVSQATVGKDADFTEMVKLVEQWSGVTVQANNHQSAEVGCDKG
ncbi:MAG: NAD(P)-dependent oxidoreductase [Ostreibacterium sp.]